MTTNYNVIIFPSEVQVDYKIGDTFFSTEQQRIMNWRVQAFDGLVIRNIDYAIGTRLHFEFDEWMNNLKSGMKRRYANVEPREKRFLF